MRKFMFLRWLGVVIVFTIALGVFPSMVKAATTATVTVNATPSWVAITNTPSAVYLLTTSIVSSSDTTPISTGATPATTAGFFTLASQSTVAVNVNVYSANFTSSGSIWTLATNATPGTAIVGMYAGTVSGTFGTVITTTPGSLLKSLAANVNGSVSSASQTWHLKVMVPTEFTDRFPVTGTITLSAVAS
jgi:hypothetical protein